MLVRDGLGDVEDEVLEIHVRPLERQQVACTQAGQDIQKYGAIARNFSDVREGS